MPHSILLLDFSSVHPINANRKLATETKCLNFWKRKKSFNVLLHMQTGQRTQEITKALCFTGKPGNYTQVVSSGLESWSHRFRLQSWKLMGISRHGFCSNLLCHGLTKTLKSEAKSPLWHTHCYKEIFEHRLLHIGAWRFAVWILEIFFENVDGTAVFFQVQLP